MSPNSYESGAIIDRGLYFRHEKSQLKEMFYDILQKYYTESERDGY